MQERKPWVNDQLQNRLAAYSNIKNIREGGVQINCITILKKTICFTTANMGSEKTIPSNLPLQNLLTEH